MKLVTDQGRDVVPLGPSIQNPSRSVQNRLHPVGLPLRDIRQGRPPRGAGGRGGEGEDPPQKKFPQKGEILGGNFAAALMEKLHVGILQ